MLSCREITELVTEYVEGRLPLHDRLRFGLHIGTCRHCRTYLRQTRLTARVLSRLPEPRLPQHVENGLLRRFDSWNISRG